MILFPFVDFHFECNNSSTIRPELVVLIYMIPFSVCRFSFLVQQHPYDDELFPLSFSFAD